VSGIPKGGKKTVEFNQAHLKNGIRGVAKKKMEGGKAGNWGNFKREIQTRGGKKKKDKPQKGNFFLGEGSSQKSSKHEIEKPLRKRDKKTGGGQGGVVQL